MNYRTSGLKQDHLGRFYMLQQNVATMKIKEIIVPVIENCEPFDLRASFGHLWKWTAEGYVAEPCRSGCSVCKA